MRAASYAEFGSADVIKIADVPRPQVGPGTVLVRVKAAGVNPADNKLRAGAMPDMPLPVIPGWDVAGVVEQPGPDTPDFQAGDEIFAYVRNDVGRGDAYAEYVAVPVNMAARKPAALSFEEAAAVPLAGLTALESVRRSGLRAGQAVLVHAAAGGVGSFAVQLAVHAGARVVGTASETNHEYLRSLGAEPIVYGEGLVERAKALTPQGYDVILDYVGGEAIDTAPQLLAPGGRIVSIVDDRARTELGGEYVWVQPSSDDLAYLASLADDGVLGVHVAAVFDLDHAAEAMRAVESGHIRGKVVIRV